MKLFLVFKIGFMIAGTALLVIAGFLFVNTYQFLGQSVKAKGTVIELTASRSSDNGLTYFPVVQFNTSNGKRIVFTASQGNNPPSYLEGEQVQLLYKAGEPENARIDSYFSLWGGATILSVMGSIFFAVGFGFFFYAYLKKRKVEHLLRHGTSIMSEVKSVDLDTSFSVNGKNPFYITTHWINPFTSQLHIFESDHIWFDPSEYVQVDQLKVLVDMQNPKKYHVDLSFLPTVSD